MPPLSFYAAHIHKKSPTFKTSLFPLTTPAPLSVKDFISSHKTITMRKNPSFRLLLLPVLLWIGSCQKELRTPPADDPAASSLAAAGAKATKPAALNETAAKKQEADLVQSVRAATSRFHSTTQALKANYNPDVHCVSVPGLGGMGYHWVNESLVDPVFEPLKPEAVLYAPGPGGKLKLVAVEYVVIKTPNQPTPMFGNQPFDDGGTPVPVPHWSLHVWVHEANPSGLFAPFNPNVSCQ